MAAIKSGTQSLSDELKLEYISRTGTGAFFYVFLAAVYILFLDGPVVDNSIWKLGLAGVAFTMLIRFLYFYFYIRLSENKLKSYAFCAVTSVIGNVFWGLAMWASMHSQDPNGEGILMYITFAGVVAGLTYAMTPIPWIQVTTILSVGLGVVVGLLHPVLHAQDIRLIVLCILCVIYNLVIGKKQYRSLLLIYSQQARIRKDLSAAKDIQRSLLPSTQHRYRDAQIEILYRPCEELSGDFFEIHEHEKFLIFYVADVTSHGTASAQVTFLLKGIFKNLVSNLSGSTDIAKFIKKMALEYITYGLEYSVSLMVCQYNLETGDLDYVSSSFPDICLISKEASEVFSAPKNPYIDAAHFDISQEFQSSHLRLLAGQSVFFFTDGSYEFKDKGSGREFGHKRFFKLLKEFQSEGWRENLLKSIQKINHSDVFEDDITVLRLLRQNEASSSHLKLTDTKESAAL